MPRILRCIFGQLRRTHTCWLPRSIFCCCNKVSENGQYITKRGVFSSAHRGCVLHDKTKQVCHSHHSPLIYRFIHSVIDSFIVHRWIRSFTREALPWTRCQTQLSALLHWGPSSQWMNLLGTIPVENPKYGCRNSSLYLIDNGEPLIFC